MSPSTDLVIKSPQSVAPKTSAIAITGDLEQQVRQMDLAARLAETLCASSLCPKAYHRKPAEGAIAIMAGAKWGLDAISSLQSVFVVHGTPSTYARVMAAVVMANGHELWTVESGPTKVAMRGHRKGSPEKVFEVEWTIERAQKAGYFTNSKYKTEPENMLYARCAAELSRRVAPDALLGMPYSKEELMDVELMQVESERVDDPLREAALRGTTTPTPEVTVDLGSVLASIQKIGDEDVLKKIWADHRDLFEEDSAERKQLSQAITARLEALRAAQEAATAPDPEPTPDSNEPVDAETVDDPNTPVDRSDEIAELFGAEADAEVAL